MSDLKQLDVLINDAGQQPTAINSAIVAALANGVPFAAIQPVLTPLAKLSLALQAIQAWSTDAQRPAAPSVKESPAVEIDPDVPNPNLVIKAPDFVPLTGAAFDAMRRLQHGQAGDGGSAEVVGLLRAEGKSETEIRDYITQYGPEGQLRRYIDLQTGTAYGGLPVSPNPDGTLSWNGHRYASEADITLGKPL